MASLKIFIGIMILGIAWILLFRAGMIYRFNAWVRDVVFNDQIILFSGRRVALLLIILGGVSLFSGIDNIVDDQKLKPRIANEMLERSQVDFHQKKYKRVIKRCAYLVRSDPRNFDAWILLASAWWTMGDKVQARRALTNIRDINPTVSYEEYPILNIIANDNRSKIKNQK